MEDAVEQRRVLPREEPRVGREDGARRASEGLIDRLIKVRLQYQRICDVRAHRLTKLK
jgi:hypothetical protein